MILIISLIILIFFFIWHFHSMNEPLVSVSVITLPNKNSIQLVTPKEVTVNDIHDMKGYVNNLNQDYDKKYPPPTIPNANTSVTAKDLEDLKKKANVYKTNNSDIILDYSGSKQNNSQQQDEIGRILNDEIFKNQMKGFFDNL